MAYLKPQSPIKSGEDHIYPLTTYDQIIMSDGSRWDGTSSGGTTDSEWLDVDLEGAAEGELALTNADMLGGIAADQYALKTEAGGIKSLTADEFEALTTEEKAAMYAQGVRVIAVDSELDSDSLTDMQRFASFAHPVGEIVSLNIPTNPATLWGIGVWESFMPGRVLVGAGTADSGTVYEAGAIGGEEQHTLKVDEMPSHRHIVPTGSTDGTYTTTGYETKGNGYYANNIASLSAAETGRTGGSQPHNIMQPYAVVYRWLRTV